MKKLLILIILLILLLPSFVFAQNIFYLDYENGNDENDGTTWAKAWKTFTTGATAARIAPGDVIRIAKSPAPVSIGNGTWTNLSKTITLASAQNTTIDNCETAWTKNNDGDTTVTRTAVSTDAKQGSYCMKLALDSSPQTGIMQAYYKISDDGIDFSGYQKISFWIKNSAAILATHWTVRLCSDTEGATTVDTFIIPAIPSTARWIPLTLTKDGGGNLGNAIKSIAIWTGTVAPTASSNILVDNFIACTTAGLNLQSLISKNSLEQGGSEGWFGIQSIDGVTVLLDNHASTKANAGQGYYGTTETITTYKRETIKTDMVTGSTTAVNTLTDNGSAAALIEYQGGYNISTTEQDGETFFDGLNGLGYGILGSSKSYLLLNHLSLVRYNVAFMLNVVSYSNLTNSYISNVTGNGIQLISGSIQNMLSNIVANNSDYGIWQKGNTNVFDNITANGNNWNGFRIDTATHANRLGTVSTNGNGSVGMRILGYGHYIKSLVSKNNATYGLSFESTTDRCIIGKLETSGNTTSGIYIDSGVNIIGNATIGEATKVTTAFTAYQDEKLVINNLSGYVYSLYNYGNIVSQDATAGGTGIEWKLSPTNVLRGIYYPLILSVAKIAVIENKLVTVKLYFKKSHATEIGARLVCRGGQLAGVNDTYTEAPDDTERNQVTISFTPTEQGVVEIEAWAYAQGSAVQNVIVDDIEITQAD